MITRRNVGFTWILLCALGIAVTALLMLALPAGAAPAAPTPGCMVESPHPYPAFINQTWTIANPSAGAQYMRLHFSRLETERAYDVVIIRDGWGYEVQRYSGDFPDGLWTDPIAGSAATVQLVTDGSRSGWGFCVDHVESVDSALAAASATRNATATSTATSAPQSTSNVWLRFAPARSEVALGMIFQVDVLLASGSQPIDSVDATITFDPAFLQVVDARGNPATTMSAGAALPMPLINRVDNEAGKIAFGAVRRLGDASPAGDLLLGTIRFRALAQTLSPDGTTLAFGEISQAYAGGLPILEGVEKGQVIIQAPWFTGKVAFEGRGSPPNRRWAGQLLNVTLTDESGNTLRTFTTTTDENGYFALLSPPSGTFNLQVKGANTLSAWRGRVMLPASDIIDFGRLRAGDANGDDQITDADLALLNVAYGGRPTQPAWDRRADFNGDDSVDVADFSLLTANYGMRGPTQPELAIESRGTRRPAAAETLQVWIEPARRLVDQGHTFDVSVWLNAQGKSLDAVNIQISFDPSILAVVNQEDRPASQVQPGADLPTILMNTVDHAGGTISLQAGIVPGSGPTSGHLHLATIRFVALKYTGNGWVGTPLDIETRSEVYLAGEPQTANWAGGTVVVSAGTGKTVLPTISN